MARARTGSAGTGRGGSKGRSSKLKHKPTEHARNYAQIAWKFAREAADDRKGKKHCKWVHLAARRHLRDLRQPRRWGYYFDPWHANDICDFAEKFPHVEGSWDTETIHLEPAQIFILCCVFGWRRVSDGGRRFSKVYIEMARKGAKSTMSAIVALYCLTCDGEVGPQVIVAATTGEQAQKVFLPAFRMVGKQREFREAFGAERWGSEQWPRSITAENSGGFIQPINAKSSTQDGWNPHCGILDELHAHKTRGLYDVIASAFGARQNPLMWIITTAGYNVEGVCYEQHKQVKKVLQQVVELDHYFGIIFTLDDEDDEFDETKWIKANPLLGITPTWSSMRSYASEAKSSPDTRGEFLTKRLNRWTSAKNSFLNIEHWKRCDGPVDLETLTEVPCFGGLDLASTTDIAAFVLTWMVEERLKVWARFWLPENTVWPRTERGNVPYQRWVEEGHLKTTPGSVIDYDYIQRDIEAALDEFDIRSIGFDPWNATQIVNNLLEQGAPMVQVRQGGQSLNPPMRELERLNTARMIDHGGNPVLTWMASNLVARRDVNNNLAPDKKHSEEKIDGVVALLNAMAEMLAHKDTTSVYESRGIRVL